MIYENLKNLVLINLFISQTPKEKWANDPELTNAIENLPAISEDLYGNVYTELRNGGYITEDNKVTAKGQKFAIIKLSAIPDNRYQNLNFEKVVNGDKKPTSAHYKTSLVIESVKGLSTDFMEGKLNPDASTKQALRDCCSSLTDMLNATEQVTSG